MARNEAAVLPVPVSSMDAELAALERSTYREVADQIGYTSGTIMRARLDIWLANRGFPIYRNQQVDNFLRKETERIAKMEAWHACVYGWFPVRAQDVLAEANLGLGDNGWYVKERYARQVPLPALYMIRDIERDLPDVFAFHVSDYRAANPDPFLAAVTKEKPRVHRVVLHWDEPAFILEPGRPGEDGDLK